MNPAAVSALCTTLASWPRCSQRVIRPERVRSSRDPAAAHAEGGETGRVDATDLDANPLRQLSAWLDEARAAGQPMPDVMTIASATSELRERWPMIQYIYLTPVAAKRPRGAALFIVIHLVLLQACLASVRARAALQRQRSDCLIWQPG